MKKFIAILLIITMFFALVSCAADTDNADTGNTGTDNTGTENEEKEVAGGDEVEFTEGKESETVEEAEKPRLKFAFSYISFEDKLGNQFRQSLQYLGDAFNVEMVFFEESSGDYAITALESVLAAGDIDGVIQTNATPAKVAVANKYNVPYIVACGFPSKEEEVKGVTDYDNFLGGVIDDDYWAGCRIVEALYEAGCRNICFTGLTAGIVKSHDDRARGVKDTLAKHEDMNLLAETYSMAQFAKDVATYNAAFPELEGIGFSAMGDGIYHAMEAEGIADGSVKIAAVDISSLTGEYLNKGVQVWTCGGQYATAMVAWAILYNYVVDDTVIIPNPSQPLVRKYLEITSYEDYEQYVKYVESPTPVYNVDEIAQMIHYFNPDVTYEDFVRDAENYTIENIKARREG